ncbi:MAG: MmgE/PrpD family protein, partial [Chloroflexota bacterium]
MSKTPLLELAKFVATHEFQPSAATVTTVQNALIDTLGCILVGSHQPVSNKTRRTVSIWGDGPAPAYGTSLKLAPPWAALANGTAGHALDYDDWESPGNSHISTVIFPALLAAAYSTTRSVSGRQIIDAYIAGFEVCARIGEAVNFEHYAKGWHSTATIGAIGAAAAVARLYRLNPKKTKHALAISISQAIGYQEQFGSDTKPLHAGFAAKAGVLSATLAKNGITGQPNVLDGPRGFSALMGTAGMAQWGEIMSKIGNPLAVEEFGLVVKPYSSCGYTHRAMGCARAISQTRDFDLEQIKKITVSLPDFHAAILPFEQPKNQAEAMFSLPFCTAMALVYGRVTPNDLAHKKWQDPQIKKIIPKVKVHVRVPKNLELNYDPADPDWVEIEYSNKAVSRREEVYPLGYPSNPMTSKQILEKFLDCSGLD